MRLFVMMVCFIFSEFGWTSEVCESAYQNFQKRFSTLEMKYATISDTTISGLNKPSWTWGRKKQAVYLLHGFIGSPEEMSQAANQLQKLNYTVINDLIPGYGADGLIANAFDSESWVNHVEANLKQVRRCFDKVHLVGFSTGGLLLHNYVRKHKQDFTAQSLTLYSPFYKPHFAFADFLRFAARVVTPIVLTKPLYYLTRFPDIKIAALKPENYLQQLPLDGAKSVFELGAKVNSEIEKNPLGEDQTSVLLFVSETDQIMHLKTTVQNVATDFLNLKLVHFTKQYVPHHLMVSEVSTVAPQVLKSTVEFIQAHGK